MKKIKNKWLTSKIVTACTVICIIFIFIYLNVFINSLNIQSIDLTKEKLYSLSESTKDALKQIDETVNIIAFGFENTSTIDLIKKYNKQNKNIIVETANAISRPDIAKEYNLSNGDSLIIIKSGDREKMLGPADLYNRDFLTYEIFDLTEQKITNSIVAATILEIPTIYMLTGHNEYSIEQYDFIISLENELNELKQLDLILVESVPEDCDVIVIATPKTDLKDVEVDKLIEYINNGGKILFLNDSIDGALYPNMQRILDLFGVAFARGVVLEQDSNKMYFDDSRFIIPDLDVYSKVSSKIASSNGRVMLINSGVLNIVTEEKQTELNVVIEPFITSSTKSFLRENLENESTTKTKEDKTGPFILGAKIDKYISDTGKESTLIVIANNMFTTSVKVNIGENSQTAAYLYNNLDLSLNAISTLTEREDTITIRKNIGAVTYVPTLTQNRIIMVIIFVIPAMIVIMGILIGIRRKIHK